MQIKILSLKSKKIIAQVNIGDGVAIKNAEWNGQIGGLFTNQLKIQNLKIVRMNKNSSKKKMIQQKKQIK